MGTALIYLLVVVAVAAAVFGLTSAVFGRGEELAPLPPGATPTRLPVGDVEGDDVGVVLGDGAIIPVMRPAPPANPPVSVLAEGIASAIVVRAHAMDSAIGWCHATP